VNYLTVADVIELHDREVEPGIRDYDLIDSAVAQPAQDVFGQELYPTVHLKAAVLLRGIVANHGFVDGNKRTGLKAMAKFYLYNGYVISAPDGDVLHLILDVVVEHHHVEKIADQLELMVEEI